MGEEARFGPDESVLVDLVESPRLRPAHDQLLGAFAAEVDGLKVSEPAYAGGGYRPHRTVTGAPRPAPGDELHAPTIAMVELDPPGLPWTGVVLAQYDLGRPLPADAETDAGTVLEVLAALESAGVRSWVIGGWGVDALVGDQSRRHHDLDLFIEAERTQRAIDALAEGRWIVRAVWSENRWTRGSGGLIPSAFVATRPDGREVDVHTVELGGARAESVSASVIELPIDALEATGTIGGRRVPCASVDAQLVMHSGYDLPALQRGDVARLRRLVQR